MGDHIRTFVAIEFPATALRDVRDDLAGLGRPVRVVGEPLHLTLKFLGETERSAVDGISAVIDEACAQVEPFEVELAGLGAFPCRERPSVIWAGVLPVETLAALSEQLESRLEPLGFARESRAFHPHITLARVKGRPPQGLGEVFDLYSDETFGTLDVHHVTLYQSELRRPGPQYTALRSAPLGDTPTSQ